MSFVERGGRTRVRVEMDGRTKGFIPEINNEGTMQDQLKKMVGALRERLAGP